MSVLARVRSNDIIYSSLFDFTMLSRLKKFYCHHTLFLSLSLSDKKQTKNNHASPRPVVFGLGRNMLRDTNYVELRLYMYTVRTVTRAGQRSDRVVPLKIRLLTIKKTLTGICYIYTDKCTDRTIYRVFSYDN